VDRSKPARLGAGTGVIYLVASSGGKVSPPVLMRQLRGPHLSTVAVVEETVEHGGDGGSVAEHLAAVLHRAVEVKSVLARS